MTEILSPYVRAVAAIRDYVQRHPLAGSDFHLVDELCDLLEQLDPLLNRVRQHNAFLLRTLGDVLPSPDDTLALLRKRSEQDSILAAWFAKNPNPVVADQVISTGHVRGKASPKKASEVRQRETLLYQDTILFYRHAHRIMQIAKRHPWLPELDCREISIVRNQLLEHPEGRPAATLPSFGWGTTGPRVKPSRSASDAVDHKDLGLFHNEARFALAVQTMVEKLKPAS